MMTKHLPRFLSLKKCRKFHDEDGVLILARNNTTTYQYFWCPICRFVHKDTDFDGEIG